MNLPHGRKTSHALTPCSPCLKLTEYFPLATPSRCTVRCTQAVGVGIEISWEQVHQLWYRYGYRTWYLWVPLAQHCLNLLISKGRYDEQIPKPSSVSKQHAPREMKSTRVTSGIGEKKKTDKKGPPVVANEGLGICILSHYCVNTNQDPQNSFRG